MTIDEEIRYLKEDIENNIDCGDLDAAENNKQRLAWLEELKALREENDTLKTGIIAVKSGSDVLKICKLEEENAELKRLLKIAVEDLALCTISCIGINCDHCHFTSNLEERGCKWEHAEEALRLIGDEDNEQQTRSETV